MTAFVRTAFEDHFSGSYAGKDPMDLLNLAVHNGDRTALNRLLQYGPGPGERPGMPAHPSCIVRGTTDDNTAVLNTGAKQSYLVDLTGELGVAFGAGFSRDIEVRCWTRDETRRAFQHIRQTVIGSATAPTIADGVKNLSPLVGGRCTFANSGTDLVCAAPVGGFTVTETQAAAGRYVAGVPVQGRSLIVRTLDLGTMGTGSLAAAAAHAHLNAVNLTTGVLELGTRLGDAATNLDTADTMTLDAWFEWLPTESCELAIDTVDTPDSVIVGALGQSSENVEWYAEIYVSDPYVNTVAADSDA